MPVYTMARTAEGVSGEEAYNRESTPIRIIPEDTRVLVEVLDVQRKKMTWTDKETGADVWRLEFTFKIVEGEYEKQRIWQEIWEDFTDDPRCRLRHWAQELLRQPLDPEFQLDTDHLIGKHAIAVVGIYEWTKQDGSDGIKNTVKFLQRLKDDQTAPEPSAPSGPTRLPSYEPGEEPF